MPIFRFQGPDGKVHRVEAATPEEAESGLNEMWAAREPDQVRGFVKGAALPLGRMANIANAMNPLEYIPGLRTDPELMKRAEEGMNRWTAGDAEKRPGKIGEFAGNIVGTLPTLALPGGSLVQGAAGGALLSEADNPAKFAGDVALGGAGGVIGDKVVGALGKAAQNASDPAVQLLRKAGVSLTPGQALGGALKAWEDKATSQPFVGNAIAKGRDEALEGFNKAGYARALDPIKEKLSPGTKAGHDAIAEVGDKISAAYDALIPSLKAVRDPQLVLDLKAIAPIAKRAPDKAKQIAALLKSNLTSRFDRSGQITGQALKDAQKSLAYDARRFGKSLDPDQQIVGEAMEQARTALLSALERANPQAREALRAVDTAFANNLRLEKAASAVGAKEGRFTPQQLASAVKAVDSSGRKKAVSRGEALMQDLSKAGQKVLQSSIPDSGTAGRSALMNPVAMAMGAAGYGGYQGGKALAAALKRVPPGAAAQLKRLAAPGGYLSGISALQLSGE